MRQPAYLRKPSHRKTVVATSRGWVVEETGELLVKVRDLDKKLAEHISAEIAEVTPDVTEVEVTDSAIEELISQVEAATVEQIEAPEAEELKVEEKPAPKKRGRKPKVKVEDAAE